jgi:hypothetical protein
MTEQCAECAPAVRALVADSERDGTALVRIASEQAGAVEAAAAAPRPAAVTAERVETPTGHVELGGRRARAIPAVFLSWMHGTKEGGGAAVFKFQDLDDSVRGVGL